MSDAGSPGATRASSWLIRAGAVAVVLAAVPYKLFDLDRYFVPKELVLHLTALLAVLPLLASARRLALTRVDTLLAVFTALSVASAAGAVNAWMAERALAITISGLAVFWAARAVSRGGEERRLLAWLVLAVAIGAVTSLLQAYGVESRYFSLNRSPGGTFGNRNFMAHLAVIALPALLYLAVTARGAVGVVAGAAATVVLSAALVLSRSRAAMLALIAFGVILAIGAWRLRARWGLRGTGRRFEVLAACAMAGVIAAVLLPNTLNWKSDSPYLDTVTGVVNYREGSGRGRLVQYTNTLHMTKEHPLLGVGPGNWSVQYPHYAARDDPSIDQDDGMTSNPWPSSDWAAFVSERGAIATGVLLLALAGLAAGALLAMSRASRPDQYLAGLALLGTVVTTVIVGAFDAVLLLPAPALLVWALLGALAPAAKTRLAIPLGGTARRWAAVAAGAMWVCFVARSAGQLAAMSMFTASTHVKEMEQASLADPGSYRIHLRLAQLGVERGSCERARRHGSRAHALFPNAPEPRRLLARCGIRVRRTG